MAKLEVQRYLRSELLPATVVAVVQVVRELAMQPRPIYSGQPPVDGLAVQGVPELVVSSELFIGKLRNTDGTQKLLAAGQFLTKMLDRLRFHCHRGRHVGNRKALARYACGCEDGLLGST